MLRARLSSAVAPTASAQTNRLLAEEAGLRPPAGAHQGTAEGAQHLRTFRRRWLRRDEGHRGLVRHERPLAVAGAPQEVPEPGLEQPGGDGVVARVDEVEREPDELEGAVGRAGQVGVVRRAPAEREAAGRFNPLGDEALEVEGALEVAMRVGVGLDRLGRIGGAERMGVGVAREPGLGEVHGELRGGAGGARVRELGPFLEPAREALMEPPAGAG